MEKAAPPVNKIEKIHRLENPKINAKRLLERLKSPFLHLASELPLNESPHSHLSASLSLRSVVAAKIETLSSGRFTLARDQQLNDSELSRYTRLKMVHIGCQRESWVSMAQLEVFGGTEKCCCYCSEPLSLAHIGSDLAEIQKFVEIRSGGKVRFSDLNSIEDVDESDVFFFECLNPCRGLVYDAPFGWFLRDSKPGNSREDTCACPCCMAIQKEKIKGGNK